MPGGDKTGPNGQGAMTGRGMGYCSGSDQPGYATGAGRGMGGGRGMRGGGRGMGRVGTGVGQRVRSWFRGNPNQGVVNQPNPQQDVLAEENAELNKKLDALNKKLADLQNKIDKLADK